MAEEPSRLFGQAQHATDLKCGDALLARHHEMRSGKPLVERHLGALVQRAHGHGERLAAGVALVHARASALALHEGGLIDHAAMRAEATMRPDPRLKPL